MLQNYLTCLIGYFRQCECGVKMSSILTNHNSIHCESRSFASSKCYSSKTQPHFYREESLLSSATQGIMAGSSVQLNLQPYNSRLKYALLYLATPFDFHVPARVTIRSMPGLASEAWIYPLAKLGLCIRCGSEVQSMVSTKPNLFH